MPVIMYAHTFKIIIILIQCVVFFDFHAVSHNNPIGDECFFCLYCNGLACIYIQRPLIKYNNTLMPPTRSSHIMISPSSRIILDSSKCWQQLIELEEPRCGPLLISLVIAHYYCYYYLGYVCYYVPPLV